MSADLLGRGEVHADALASYGVATRLQEEGGWAQPFLRTLLHGALSAHGVGDLPALPEDAEALREAFLGLRQERRGK